MVQKRLRDGLILRSLSEGTEKDRETLPQFYYDVFNAVSDDYDEAGLPILIEDMLNNHPTMTPDDYWVVVDPAKDEQIVSAVLLIPQKWQYSDIEIGMGRPEIVATHEDYRNRGLIRELMTVCHQRSADLGHIMQGITGIAEYYRKFGYATTVPLGAIATLPFHARMP